MYTGRGTREAGHLVRAERPEAHQEFAELWAGLIAAICPLIGAGPGPPLHWPLIAECRLRYCGAKRGDRGPHGLAALV